MSSQLSQDLLSVYPLEETEEEPTDAGKSRVKHQPVFFMEDWNMMVFSSSWLSENPQLLLNVA